MHLRKHGESAVLAPAAPLSLREQLTLSVLWFGLNFQTSALLPIVVPIQVALFITPGQFGSASQVAFVAALSAAGAVLSLIIPPVSGALSDHTPGPWGRRRPYILVGAVLLVLGALELASARRLGTFALGLIVFQIGSGIATAAYQSLVPDRVPAEQRGTSSGYIGLMTILGNVGSLGVAGLLLGSINTNTLSQNAFAAAIIQGAYLYYGFSALMLVVTVAITVLGVREVPLSMLPYAKAARSTVDEEGRRLSWRRRFARDWLGPWHHRNFTWVFLTRVFVILGLTIFMTYIEYYFSRVAGMTNFVQGTAVIAVLALFGAVFSAITLGILSDRVGRVKLVCVATFFMGLAALPFVIAPGGVPLWPLGIVFGLGYGAYSAVDWALAIDALPSLATAGKDMGIWSIASNLPAVLAPLVGGVVIEIASGFGNINLGYRLVFALADLFFLLGAFCVLFVRETAPTREAGRTSEATM